jgi:hypothetical protein
MDHSESPWTAVLTDVDDNPLYGVRIEWSDKQLSVITNTKGEFTFLSPPDGVIVVRDRAGNVINEFDTSQSDNFKIDIANAQLLPQPNQESLINPNVFTSIIEANERFFSDPTQTLQAFDSFVCSLPPILRLPDLVGIAEGVLQGRGEELFEFRERLDNLEQWNHRSFSYDRPALEQEQAEFLLSDDHLSQIRQDNHQPNGLISQRQVATLVGAAMLAADNPVTQNRNIGIIVEQLAGFNSLFSLFDSAESALLGGDTERQAFASRMEIFSPSWQGGFPSPFPGPFPNPNPGPFPGPFPNPNPGPIPGPFPFPMPGGGPPWPPAPGGGSGGIPPGDPCLPEYLEAFRESRRRMATYSITEIVPQGACPGEEITITGSGFIFEGGGGVVNFPSDVRGVKVPVEPVSWSDTEIKVIVPENACDGFLDLDIPGSDTIIACDVEIELFVASGDPVPFKGGQTRLISFDVPESLCYDAGDNINVAWRGCNIDQVRLEILTLSGDVLAEETLLEEGVRRPASFTVPELRENSILRIRLEVNGPCGTDSLERRISVERSLSLRGSNPFGLPGDSFENFLRNIRRNDIRIAQIGPRPSEGLNALERLLKAIEVCESAGLRLGIRGSACSYTDIVVPRGTTDRMLDPDGMFATNRDLDSRLPEPALAPPSHIVEVMSRALRVDLSDEHSIFSSDVLTAYQDVRDTPLMALRDRLIHVESGMKMARLVCLLERLGLSMPTLGGGVPQSVAGAIGTASHGSTLRLPPIADFVRAIHFVGPGGVQWWLEPSSARITEPAQMEALRREGILDPCIRIRYDDDLFDAVLVSFGAAGIIYSVIIEAIDEQVYRAETSQPSWDQAQRIVRTRVVNAPTPRHWFLDVTFDPTGRVRLSTLDLVSPDTPLSENPDSIVPEIAESVRQLLVGLPRRLGRELPLYIARESIRALNPFNSFRIIREIRETIELVSELIRLIEDLTRIFASHFAEEEIAEAFPNVINLLWRLGSRMGIGRSIVDELQNIVTESERPTGTYVRKNRNALNFTSTPCPEDDLPPNVRTFDDAFSRLARSSEYIVPADQTVPLANAIRRVAERVREGPDALVVVINLRWTEQTRALVGMQRFPLSGHIEIFTFKNLNGNGEFERLLEPELRRFGAIPHWGQLHSNTDYENLYGENLDRWRDALDELAIDSDTPNTFRHAFVRDRGILDDL